MNCRNSECAEPCRCEFVQKWLDAHAKYFPRELPRLVPPMPPSQRYLFSPLPIVSSQVPYYVDPPHRISPMRPIYH